MRSNPDHFLIFILAWALLWGCLSSSRPDHPPGYLIVAIESNPTHLDPRYSTDANSDRICTLIFNSLMRIDEDSRLRPDLAEHWEAMVASWYERVGYDRKTGNPKPELLESLGLEQVAKDVWG